MLAQTFTQTYLPETIREHPCYGVGAHFKFGRVHLPVATGCNISCNYCVRKYDCANENRPGVTSRVITPKQALGRVQFAARHDPRLRVVGVSGPGDPLCSDVTFETLKLVHAEFPNLTLCLSTNGLLLPQKLDLLKEVGVKALTITINAVDADVGSQIYSSVRYDGKTLHGKKAFQVLNRNQLEGLRSAVEAGMVVKVNSVYIPGINAAHLPQVAETVSNLGAYIMNIMPLIPQGKFAHVAAPTMHEVQTVRRSCSGMLYQFHNCVQCRADASGVPSEESCKTRFSKFASQAEFEFEVT